MNLNEKFIEPELKVSKKMRSNASYVRKQFTVSGQVKKAQLSISACGIYKAYLNGEDVDDQVLLPGFTYYTKRIQYQVYDITQKLCIGENVIGAVVGDGWYRGENGIFKKTNYYGTKTKLMCVIEITYKNGAKEVIETNETWKATQEGPIRFNDLQGGEDYDANKEMYGWTTANFDDSNWHGVIKRSYSGKVVLHEGEKLIEKEHFKPEIIRTPDGSTVLDFKQNIFGYVFFKVNGKKEQKVRLIHGETLDEHGNFTQKNLFVSKKEHRFQEISIILKDGHQTYKPTLTAQGFQYVKVENWPEEVLAENFTAIVVTSDLKAIGEFECSNPLVNQLVSNAKWSQKGNFADVPTDCPTRERAGWTGDIALFSETALYLTDASKFLRKWLNDVALQQSEKGVVPNVVPDVGVPKFFNGSAGWADCITIIPFMIYKFNKDEKILDEFYLNMKKWVDFSAKRAKKKTFRTLLKNNRYNEYIVDSGYHWGEWLEPGFEPNKALLSNIFSPDSEVATAYFAYSTKLLSEAAQIIGKVEDHKKYSELFKNIKQAYQQEFIKNNKVISERDCRYVRPIALGLVGKEQEKNIAADLNKKVIANDYKIGTGFLSTPYILDVLTDNGYVDTAYKMVENTNNPGWLYAVNKGATTFWESWNGKDDAGKPEGSMNHYAFGSVVAWFYKYSAGIKPLAPGFEKIQIKPYIGTFEFVNCTYNACSGDIVVNWKVQNDIFNMSIDVPVESFVVLPDGSEHIVQKGSHKFQCTVLEHK